MKRANRTSKPTRLWLKAMIATVGVTAAVALTNVPTASAAPGDAPTITQQPTDTTVTAPAGTTFTAKATTSAGDLPPTAQWQERDTPGDTYVNVAATSTSSNVQETTTMLTLPSTTVADDGHQYRVTFTNADGNPVPNTTDTAVATLTVNAALAAPVVTTNPVSQTGAAGDPVSFNAAASGNPTPTVQWQRSIDGGTVFADITGATSNTYAFTATAADVGAQFRARYTNSQGSANSSAASLNAPPPALTAPKVTANPVDRIANPGDSVTFASAASGNPSPTVQWQRSSDDGDTYTDIAGATSQVYTFTATGSDFGDVFRARFTNSQGSVNSGPAMLTKTPAAPQIVANPNDTTATAGDSVTFSGYAIGTPSPTAQWQKSTNGGTTYTDIAGATGDNYTFTATAGDIGTKYRAHYTNTAGSANTAAATLTATPVAPLVTTQPSDKTVAAGGNVTFTAAASGTPAATVQWQRSTDNGTTYTNITGATSASYTVTGAALTDTGNKYRAVFTNSAGTVNSNAATLTVTPAPAVATVAGRSATGTLTVRTGASTYTDLGGVVVGTPVAVQAAGGRALFVVQSSDKNVYIRDTTLHYKRLTTTSTVCNDPDATISGTTLTVTCRTATNSVSFATATVAPGALPTLGAFTSLGGSVTSGAAVWVDAGVTHVAAVGKYGRTVFTRTTATTGAGSTFSGTNSLCSATPTALVTGGHTYIACRNADGALAISRDDATPVTKGKIVGRVGLVAAGANLAATVEGTDGRVLDAPVDATTAAIGSFVGQTNKVTTGVTAATPLS